VNRTAHRTASVRKIPRKIRRPHGFTPSRGGEVGLGRNDKLPLSNYQLQIPKDRITQADASRSDHLRLIPARSDSSCSSAIQAYSSLFKAKNYLPALLADSAFRIPHSARRTLLSPVSRHLPMHSALALRTLEAQCHLRTPTNVIHCHLRTFNRPRQTRFPTATVTYGQLRTPTDTKNIKLFFPIHTNHTTSHQWAGTLAFVFRSPTRREPKRVNVSERESTGRA